MKYYWHRPSPKHGRVGFHSVCVTAHRTVVTPGGIQVFCVFIRAEAKERGLERRIDAGFDSIVIFSCASIITHLAETNCYVRKRIETVLYVQYISSQIQGQFAW